MGFIDFVDYVQTLTPTKVFPYSIPDDANAEAIVINLEPSYANSKGGLIEATLKFHTRSVHPAIAEQYSMELLNHFDNKTGFYIGETRIVLASIKNKFPLFVEKDDLERYEYTFDVNLRMQK